MAMWFAHLHFAARAARQLPALNPEHVAWGALCCDVDKVSPVSRSRSHYGSEGLDFAPEDFRQVSGLTREQAQRERSFLAGYLSHLAVDEAWYGLMFELRDRARITDWGRDTTRAYNLALDQRLRESSGADRFVAPKETIEQVLPHLGGAVGQVMRMAAAAYTRWDGSMDKPAEDPLMLGFQASFARLPVQEEARLGPALEALGSSELENRVGEFTDQALRRFLESLESA